MILEVAILQVKQGFSKDFLVAFEQAKNIISACSGYISHELKRCLEDDHRFLLLVKWEKLDDHLIGFRQSAEYQNWKSLLHHFYNPFPTVEHYEAL